MTMDEVFAVNAQMRFLNNSVSFSISDVKIVLLNRKILRSQSGEISLRVSLQYRISY